MSALAYPASLPCPQRMPFQRAERRAVSPLPSARRARTLWRDRLGAAPVQFLLTFEQVAVWLDWFENEQLYGGAWFSASWRVPFGRDGVFRFIEPPSYPEFVPIVGWRITATVEVRGRGMLPQSHAGDLIDPFFSDVRLLMHFEGDEGTRPVVDVKGHTGAWGQVNDPGTTGTPSGITTDALMGDTSVFFAPYGSTRPTFATGAYIAMTASADFALAGDFTIEFRIKPNGIWRSVGSAFRMLGTIGDSVGEVTGDWKIGQNASSKLEFYLRTASGILTIDSSSFGAVGVETIAAVVRSGNTMMLFSNGAMVDSATGVAGTTLTGAHAIGIGAAPDWASTFINDRASGVYDELRITAAARYTAAGYTPSILPFPDQ